MPSNYINPEQWAKTHKKAFVDHLIKESRATTSEHPAAIFTAGLPGAGKTEYTKALIQNFDLKILRIDMDEIASQIDNYKPEIADQFRKSATILLEETFSTALHQKLPFIMDGTFSHPKAISNINRTLKHMFSVKIIYIFQDPKLAWQFTKAREKVEHRAISEVGFINSYFNLSDNLRRISASRNQHLSINLIIKGPNNDVIETINNATKSDIDKLVNGKYTRSSLQDYINGKN